MKNWQKFMSILFALISLNGIAQIQSIEQSQIQSVFKALSTNQIAQKDRKQIIEKALQTAQKKGFLREELEALDFLGQFFYAQRDYTTSLKITQDGVLKAQKHQNLYWEARHLWGLGTNQYYLYDYPSAISSLMKSLKIAQKLQDIELIVQNQDRIGQVYKYLDEYEKALNYLLPAYQMVQNSQNPNLQKLNKPLLVNIGNCLEFQGKHSAALPYYEKYLKIGEAENNLFIQVIALNNLGRAYLGLNQLDKSLHFHQKAYQIDDSLRNPRGRAYSYRDFGRIALRKNDYPEAIKNLDRSLSIAIRTNLKSVEWENYQMLAEAYENENDFGRAYQYQKKYKYLRDSIFSRQSIERMAVLDAVYRVEYETEKKQQQINLLNKENQLKNLVLRNLQKENELKNLNLKTLNQQDSLKSLRLENLSKENSLKSLEVSNLNKVNQLKNLRLENLNKENELKNQKIAQQTRNFYFALAGIAFVLIVLALLYRNYQYKQKTNLLLAEKNEELQTFNEELNAANEELNTLNERLEQANQAKTKLFGILSHDLRAPIGKMIALLNIQRENPKILSEIEAKSFQAHIAHSGETLLDAMEDILLWAKSQMQHFELNLENIEIASLFEEMIALYQPIAQDKQITLKSQVQKTLRLDSDLNFLRTILRNLLSNALKFTPENGKIELNAWQANGHITLEIADNGQGMSEAQIKEILTFQGILSTQSGLGLKMTQEFVEKLGGKLNIQSAVGKGTKISVLLA